MNVAKHCDKNYVYRYDECQHIVQDGMKKSNKGTSKGTYLKQKQYNCDVLYILSLVLFIQNHIWMMTLVWMALNQKNAQCDPNDIFCLQQLL